MTTTLHYTGSRNRDLTSLTGFTIYILEMLSTPSWIVDLSVLDSCQFDLVLFKQIYNDNILEMLSTPDRTPVFSMNRCQFDLSLFLQM